MVDRLDSSSADRIRDDEFLADKKRLQSVDPTIGAVHPSPPDGSRPKSWAFPSLPYPLPSAKITLALGDKDSIRRRALWALEGKPSADGFSPVEIPELSSPEIERRISELPSKPSFPPSIGSFPSGLSSLANMRDSFSSRVTSIKDQLHTLVEEEEEEEEEEPEPSSSPSLPSATLPIVDPTSPTPTRARHRPAGLRLRPLSLSPDRLLSTASHELSTPAPTPTPSKLSGLKSLTLITSPNSVSSPPGSDGALPSATALHPRSIAIPPTHAASSASFFRRSSLTDNTYYSGSLDPFEAPKKRSSISYKSPLHGLPTPELTPTTDHRASSGSDSDWGRPSSVSSEQHFLYQSQAALVARISDLEAALAFRFQSRPVSLAVSDTSSSGPEPTDEMLRLIADLKAERDELKRDIDGWRTRVASLEKQSGALALASVRAAEENAATVSNLQAELTTTKADLRVLQEETQRGKEIALELEACWELSLFNVPTPIIPARRVMSTDSWSSATDVESLDGHVLLGHELKAVQEVDEEQDAYSDQENNLMGYEDEEEGDESFTAHDGSPFSSLEDIPRSTAHLVSSVTPSPSRTPSPGFLPAHVKRSSLSREWSFPAKGVPHTTSPQHLPEEIDRFFGCLEDIGDSPPTSGPVSVTTNPFSRAFFGVEDDGDELPPFVLPADVGVEVEPLLANDSVAYAGQGLSIVLEEPEGALDSGGDDEFVGEKDEGGIKFTFKIPSAFASPESSQSPSPMTPVLQSLVHEPVPYHETAIDSDDDAPFPLPIPSPVSHTRASPPSPSAIPRATALKRFERPAKFCLSPVSLSPPAVSSHIPPSTKRCDTRPSFLPQPITKAVPAPTFIPQPASKAPSSMPLAQFQSQSPSGKIAVIPSSTNGSANATVRPFAALQNLASLMPLPSPFSWSGMRISSESVSTVETNINKAREQNKGFVSKERQLARLRERMAAEGSTVVADTQICVRQQQPVPVLACKRCVDRVVASLSFWIERVIKSMFFPC
ncbi:hypothetical protein F5148DRAFT_1281329 [Russula earlei]|uniref:Uncharacterized protein n=1 Tax=Russula earlei TaxID=71964 RepID=A0ACC0UHD2_9AGAM|nr:hypothetical protein F5148DRAFT_1281329 [Russula earlei]